MIQAFFRRKDVYVPALVVFLVGALLRLYSFYFSSLLFNSDGIVYLQQAKALYLGDFSQYTACYPYPNLFTVMIVPFYWLTGHWVVAGKTVSFLFGTAMLIPLYFVFRYFFDRHMATVLLFLVAVNPFLVSTTPEVLRGPMFWFFISLGLFLFVAGLDRQKRGLFLSGSCLAYLVAFGARVDALVFLLATPGFIICFGTQGRKIRDLLGFLAPLLILGVVGGLVVVVYDVTLVQRLFRRDILAELARSFDAYGMIRDGLRELGHGGYADTVAGVPVGFFKQCRNLVVWIAFADTFGLLFSMSFQPFFLFFLFGFKGAWAKLRDDVKLRYLLVMGISGFAIVMLQELFSWFMSARFIVLCYLPLLVFAGFGIERFASFLESKKNWTRVTILLLLCTLFFVVTLPKNLKHNRADKIIFRDIGEYIGVREGGTREIHVVSFFKRVEYTNVFANLNVESAPCFWEYSLLEKEHGENLQARLEQLDADYFVWDEKHCSEDELQRFRETGWVEVTSWQTKRLGKVVLFELD